MNNLTSVVSDTGPLISLEKLNGGASCKTISQTECKKVNYQFLLSKNRK
jgi:hypothetical protein